MSETLSLPREVMWAAASRLSLSSNVGVAF
jgi:hypothetical protein